MKDINIGYAGKQAPEAPIHAAIARLGAGDPLRLRAVAYGWELADAAGATVGRLARHYVAPAGMRCRGATVQAVHVRRHDDGDAAFNAALRCEQWEVVLPELVFEPVALAVA